MSHYPTCARASVVPLEALVTVASVGGLQVDAGGVGVAVVTEGAVVHVGAELAALPRHRELGIEGKV